MENKIVFNQNQIINEKDYEIYVSNQSKPGFDDLHYFDWCEKQANKYCQNAFYYWNLNKRQQNEDQQRNLRKQQNFLLNNGNGINFDGFNNVDLSVSIPANLNYKNIFKEFYWSVCENMRLFANDVVYYLWLRIYKKHIQSKLNAQEFNHISRLKNGLDNAFKDNVSWQNFIEKLKESHIAFANIYDETRTQELFKSFDELYKSIPKEIQMFCKNIGKERFLLLLKSIYAKFLDFNGKEHNFQKDIDWEDNVINEKILNTRKQVQLCSALYKLFIKDKIEYWGLDNGKIARLRNNDLLKYAQKPKYGLFYGNDVKMRTGWNNLKGKPLSKLNEKVRNVTWMNYANWDFQDFDGINGRLPGYYDRNGNFIEGEWYWFSEQFDVMINYYDSDVNDLCDWIRTNNDANRKLSMPLVGNKNFGSVCYFNASNVSELGNPINLMFNFKLGHAILIKKDEKSDLASKSSYQDDFFVLNDIYQDNFKKISNELSTALVALQNSNKKGNEKYNDLKTKYDDCLTLKNKYNYNLSYICYVRLVMDLHFLNIQDLSKGINVSVEAKTLQKELGEANPQFKKLAANTSKDLLEFTHESKHLLNAFNNGIIKAIKTTDQNNPFVERNKLANFRFTKERSYISNSMYGIYNNSTICRKCYTVTYNSQAGKPYTDLNLFYTITYNVKNIFNQKIFPRLQLKSGGIDSEKLPLLTLWELLNSCNETEYFSGAIQIFCKNCNQLTDAEQNPFRYNILEKKSHVTLHMDRGKDNKYSVNLAVPEIIKSGSNYFCLSSVIKHSGNSGLFGGGSAHFVCFLNCQADGWRLYNDSFVIYQQNGFFDVFRATYMTNNSQRGYIYQYTKIGPTECLYLKNNETIAIPDKNEKNNKIISGAEAHCLRRAIKYFCQSHNDGNDINIYESKEGKIKSELEKIMVYKYIDSKDKNKFVTVTLWDYFQDMELKLIFPYIFQLYKRNWDTWNYYDVNHEKLEPESLVNSYEYSLCCLLIEKWNNQNFILNSVQQTVYDAINKKIPSLQINNFQSPKFNLANQINNTNINGNLNTIGRGKNLASDKIQNENGAKSKTSYDNNIKHMKSEIEIHNDKDNLSDNGSKDESIVVKQEINTHKIIENKNKEDNSEINSEQSGITGNKNDNKIVSTDAIKQIKPEKKNVIEEQSQNKNGERNEIKINTSNSTLEKNKKIAKALIIIGSILFVPAVIVLLYKIYIAAIILSLIGFVFAGIGIFIFVIKVCCIESNSELEKLSGQSGISHDKTLIEQIKTKEIDQNNNYIENELNECIRKIKLIKN